MSRDEPYRFVTVTQFAEAFKSFHVGKKINEELEIPFDKSNNHPAALTTKKYGVNKKELLKANFAREFLLMKRNSFIYLFKMVQVSSSFISIISTFCLTCMQGSTFSFSSLFMIFRFL